jgi:hypothetical protein
MFAVAMLAGNTDPVLMSWIAALTVALIGMAAALTWATGPRQRTIVAVMVVAGVGAVTYYAPTLLLGFYLYWSHDCIWLWC